MKVKRSGFVYSLYKQNIIHLWIVAGILVLIFAGMLGKSHNYLMNYLFYRSEPDAQSLTEFLNRDVIDLSSANADIEANGGEAALSRAATYMFFKDNVYQEGARYRFSIPIDKDQLTDTGIYYDDTYKAYTGVTDRSQLSDLVPRENYVTQHLYFYEYDGMKILLVLDYEKEDELGDSMRVTFAPMGVYSLYMVKDLSDAGYTGSVYNYFIDGRDTPVDFEDDDFKDLVMILPFVLLALIPAILFTVCPVLHPTYHQLNKFARTTQKAVEQVDRDYEEFGITCEEKKTLFLNEWLVKKSFFKNGIERNYKKQKN